MSTLHFGSLTLTVDRHEDLPRCPGCARHGSDHRCYCGGTGYLLECRCCRNELTKPAARERKDGTDVTAYRLEGSGYKFDVCSEECLGLAVSELLEQDARNAFYGRRAS
jgi:hypothetical protein